MNTNLLRVFIPFALGYVISYMLRTVNAVIAPNLVAELQLSAGELGLMTSVFFASFAAFQLPLGLLLDRYGPRRTEAALMLITAASAALFATSQTATGLIAGRMLLGLGTSACLMAAMTAFVLWFPRNSIPMINGCQMAAGGLGALISTVPVANAAELIGWRGVFWVVAGFSVVAAGMIFTVVPERSVEKKIGGLKVQISGIGEVFSNPLFWRIAPLTVASQASFISLQSLWSGPWLYDIGGIARADVSDCLSIIAGCMIVGFILVGSIAARLNRLGIETMQIAVIGSFIFMAVQVSLVFMGPQYPTLIWALFGFFGTVGILGYGALSQNFAQELAGRVVTGLNLLVFTAAFAVQWGVGLIIDQWSLAATGAYAKEAYDVAFMVLVGVQALTMIWYLLYRQDANSLAFKLRGF
jgi:MFS family permease